MVGLKTSYIFVILLTMQIVSTTSINGCTNGNSKRIKGLNVYKNNSLATNGPTKWVKCSETNTNGIFTCPPENIKISVCEDGNHVIFQKQYFILMCCLAIPGLLAVVLIPYTLVSKYFYLKGNKSQIPHSSLKTTTYRRHDADPAHLECTEEESQERRLSMVANILKAPDNSSDAKEENSITETNKRVQSWHNKDDVQLVSQSIGEQVIVDDLTKSNFGHLESEDCSHNEDSNQDDYSSIPANSDCSSENYEEIPDYENFGGLSSNTSYNSIESLANIYETPRANVWPMQMVQAGTACTMPDRAPCDFGTFQKLNTPNHNQSLQKSNFVGKCKRTMSLNQLQSYPVKENQMVPPLPTPPPLPNKYSILQNKARCRLGRSYTNVKEMHLLHSQFCNAGPHGYVEKFGKRDETYENCRKETDGQWKIKDRPPATFPKPRTKKQTSLTLPSKFKDHNFEKHMDEDYQDCSSIATPLFVL